MLAQLAENLFKGERLFEIVKSAAFDCFDRDIERAVRSHQNDFGFRRDAFDVFEHCDAVGVGKTQVEKDKIKPAACE